MCEREREKEKNAAFENQCLWDHGDLQRAHLACPGGLSLRWQSQHQLAKICGIELDRRRRHRLPVLQLVLHVVDRLHARLAREHARREYRARLVLSELWKRLHGEGRASQPFYRHDVEDREVHVGCVGATVGRRQPPSGLLATETMRARTEALVAAHRCSYIANLVRRHPRGAPAGRQQVGHRHRQPHGVIRSAYMQLRPRASI